MPETRPLPMPRHPPVGLLALGLCAWLACETDAEPRARAEGPRAEAPETERAQGDPPGDRAGAAKDSTRARVPNEAEANPPPKAPLVKRGRELMSTYFELALAAPPTPRATALLEDCLDEVARLEQVLSEWQPDTEISRINRKAGSGEWVKLSPEVRDVVQAGLNVSVWSHGAYDLSWAAMRGLYRFDGSHEVPDRQAIRARLERVGYRDIAFSREPPRVRLEREGMAIGTGGIAKGYALDRVSERLLNAGYGDYLLFAGGQVQVHGSRGGRPWRVGIQHPRDPRSYIGFVELSAGSVSTSGDYEHAFVADGVLWHHILDLKTGYPARRSVSVTLIAPEGVYADALSTACFVLGPARCQKMLSEELPFQAEAVIIDPELRVHVTPGLKDKVTFTEPLVDGKLRRP